jgi:GNAT superfamily N-acetyltransferase
VRKEDKGENPLVQETVLSKYFVMEKKIHLTPMDDNDLIRCRDIAATSSANDLMQIEKKSYEECVEITNDYWKKRLSKGIHTKNNYLLNITDIGTQTKVGFVWGSVLDEEIHYTFCINHFMVFDDYQGKGYGKASLSQLDKFAASKSCDGLWLSVWVKNQKALTLYEKMGYEGTYMWMKKMIVKK